ncbi:hypothetical protein [Rossellomorea aquimaris]|uniref:Uncharacterized protein n=1 Tax=Rossellomorea aquimaris TaxID=189382 RepID=A0A1J6VX38_9BACI|nr:hypothetical protein [Rossellomorea aquimaris]OIU69837.1 hypothetical protein BHE18_02705 [Rossellomorea aquimaris]
MRIKIIGIISLIIIIILSTLLVINQFSSTTSRVEVINKDNKGSEMWIIVDNSSTSETVENTKVHIYDSSIWNLIDYDNKYILTYSENSFSKKKKLKWIGKSEDRNVEY